MKNSILEICDEITAGNILNEIYFHIDPNYVLPREDFEYIGFSIKEIVELYEDKKSPLKNNYSNQQLYEASQKIAKFANKEIVENFLDDGYTLNEQYEEELNKIKQDLLYKVEQEQTNEVSILVRTSPFAVVETEKVFIDEHTKLYVQLSETEYEQADVEEIYEYLFEIK